jgi:hypothetical protein
MANIIEFDEKCKSCKGTGLYVGFAERDGIAVVCHTCNGTGKHHVKFEYEDFEKREERTGIKQVIQTNPGIMMCGGTSLEDFGGMDYKDWLNGKSFPMGSEMRKFTCPAWWFQCADYRKKPDWDKCLCCGTFLSCKHFANKHECWERFDKENKS